MADRRCDHRDPDALDVREAQPPFDRAFVHDADEIGRDVRLAPQHQSEVRQQLVGPGEGARLVAGRGLQPAGRKQQQRAVRHVAVAALRDLGTLREQRGVGLHPGRYLGVLGQLGYTVHGIDLTPAVSRMKPGLDALGLRTGDFHEADFLSFEPGRRYDVVCSFGFIEHFQDWAAVLRKHAALVAPGGQIIIETPNFRGAVQQLFHRWLDAENLKRHNLAAMVPEAWADVLRAEGFTVERAGYFGPFDFWHDSGGSGLGRRVGFGLLRLISPLLKRLPEGSATWSPYAGLIAHKR